MTAIASSARVLKPGHAYLCDLDAAGICWATGAKPWSEARGLHRWTWRPGRGVPFGWLEATGDAQALRVVACARAREAGAA